MVNRLGSIKVKPIVFNVLIPYVQKKVEPPQIATNYLYSIVPFLKND